MTAPTTRADAVLWAQAAKFAEGLEPTDRMVEAATEAYFNAFLDNLGQETQMRAAIRAAMKAAGE